MVENDGRPAVLIYAGDLDPSGEDILRDLGDRCDVFTKTEHIAVRPAQVSELGLVVNPGKPTDTRARGFVARHGELIQVEVEAIKPATLRRLYDEALGRWFDTPTYEAAVAAEAATKTRLEAVADDFDDDREALITAPERPSWPDLVAAERRLRQLQAESGGTTGRRRRLLR